MQGCRNGARLSMDASYIPRSVAAGARLHALAKVERVLFARGRAVGVRGTMKRDGQRVPFEMRARRGVIVAAGAIHTPILLRQSGLRGMVGERFQAHPGTSLVARFDEPVEMGFGGTQTYEVPLRDRGIKIESLSQPPELVAPRIAGVGSAWRERVSQLDHFAQWALLVRCRAHGRVRPSWLRGAYIHYEPSARDMKIMRDGYILMTEMAFAAGAKEVFTHIRGLPDVLTSIADLEPLRTMDLTADRIQTIASHLFGTACASADATRSVVGQSLECHVAPGLFVMDASVFPTNMGVNPQHSIMAVVWCAAERLANASSVATAA